MATRSRFSACTRQARDLRPRDAPRGTGHVGRRFGDGAVAAKASRSIVTVSSWRQFADREEPFRYRLRVSSGGARHEFYDIYSFPPVLGEIDIHLLAEGNHLASYRKLGAHPLGA